MPIHMIHHDCTSCWKQQLNSSFKNQDECDFVGVLIWACLGLGGRFGWCRVNPEDHKPLSESVCEVQGSRTSK